MRHFLIRGLTGAAIGYSIPVSLIFATGWSDVFGVRMPPATLKDAAMFLAGQPAAVAGLFAGCIVGLASAAWNRPPTERSN